MHQTVSIKYYILVIIVVSLVTAFSIPAFMFNKRVSDTEAHCLSANPPADCITRMRALGNIYSTSGDYKDAIFWYDRAARLMDPESMFHIGWVHYKQAIDRDNKATRNQHFKDAETWFRKSANLGFAPAMQNLAAIIHMRQMYEIYGKQNALVWIQKAAENHNPVARWTLFERGDYYGIRDPYAWKYWDPKLTRTQDMKSPTLERTLHGIFKMDRSRINALRDASESGERLNFETVKIEKGKPATAGLPAGSVQPLKPNPSLPTFREQSRKLREKKAPYSRY